MNIIGPASHKSSLQLFLYLLLWICIGLLIYGAINIGLLRYLGIDYMAVENLDSVFTENLLVFKWLQVLATVFLFALPSLMLSRYVSGNLIDFFRQSGINSRRILLSLLGLSLLFPVVAVSFKMNMALQLPDSLSWLENWMRTEEESKEKLTLLFLQMGSFPSFMLNMLMIALAPAIGEELLFRGGLQQLLIKGKMQPHLAILFSAILFSAIHFQFYGFLPRMIIGLYLGYLHYYGSNIFYSILCHFLNNGLQVLLVYTGLQSLEEDSAAALSAMNGAYYALAACCVVGITVILYLYRRSSELVNG